MTKKEAMMAMACTSVKVGEYLGEKVLIPEYKEDTFIGKPLYAFGDGSEDGWKIGTPEKNMKFFRYKYRKLILKDKIQNKKMR